MLVKGATGGIRMVWCLKTNMYKSHGNFRLVICSLARMLPIFDHCSVYQKTETEWPMIWGLWCRKQVSRARILYHILQCSGSCNYLFISKYMFLTPESSFALVKTMRRQPAYKGVPDGIATYIIYMSLCCVSVIMWHIHVFSVASYALCSL